MLGARWNDVQEVPARQFLLLAGKKARVHGLWLSLVVMTRGWERTKWALLTPGFYSRGPKPIIKNLPFQWIRSSKSLKLEKKEGWGKRTFISKHMSDFYLLCWHSALHAIS